jgi:uncharacterized protein (TIGR02246 family)
MPSGSESPRASDPLAEPRVSFVAALARGDAAAASAVYTDDAHLLAPSAELVQGREAIERFWKAGIDSGITAVDLDVVEIAGGVRLAYEIGRYALLLGGDGEAAERGAYVLVHERQRDGTWRRAVEMFNPESSRH